jgi:hypothetical protein
MLQTINLPESAIFTTGVDYKIRSANLAASDFRSSTSNAAALAVKLDGDEFDVINRLLTAAVINRRFRQCLLTNPVAAIAGGYHNEQFILSAPVIAALSSIRAATLSEFVHAVVALTHDISHPMADE